MVCGSASKRESAASTAFTELEDSPPLSELGLETSELLVGSQTTDEEDSCMPESEEEMISTAFDGESSEHAEKKTATKKHNGVNLSQTS